MLTNTLNYARRHRLTALSLAFFVAASLLSLLGAALAQTQTVTPATITLRVGGPGKAVVTKNTAGQDVTPTLKSFSEAGIAEFDAASKTFKALRAGTTTAKLEFTENDSLVALPDIEIKVLPKIERYFIKYDGAEFKNTDEVKIGQGVRWEGVQIGALNADGDPVEDVAVAVQAGADRLEISPGPTYALRAKKTGEATLRITAPGDATGQDFKFKVLSPVAAASLKVPPVRLPERATRTYTPEIKTTTGESVAIGDRTYGVKIDLRPNDYVKLKDNDKLEGQTIDVGSERKIPAKLLLPAVSFDGGDPVRSDRDFDVIVEATGAYMYFVPPTQPIFPGGSVRIEAYFRDRNGAPTQGYHVTDWSVDAPYDKYVALAEEGNSVTVILLDDMEAEDEERQEGEQTAAETRQRAAGGRGQTTSAARRAAIQRERVRQAKRPNVIPIKATARSISNPEITVPGTAYVQLRRITKFQPLSVKLNVMDETTAKDLYGGVAASEYYILMVRLFNDLRDDETKKYTGASIIVYSGSVEVAVNLEKQYDEKSRSAKRKSGGGGGAPAPNPTDGYVADGRWYEVDPMADIYKQIADPDFNHRPPSGEETRLNFGDDPVCEDTITYRPLMFEMVVNTVDRREGRSLRSKIFDGLELVGIGASFSSAIRFPRPGRDLPIITDRFTNLLVPGMEKLFPSLKEQHRQNIVSQVMKPIEEVPFGSDLTRVLFIPKRAMRGVIPDHKVRISQICPYYFKIKVAVVDKTGQSTVEQGTRR